MFVLGDKVEKYKAYSPSLYCRWGGEEEYIPLGSKGNVVELKIIDGIERVVVSFENGITWSVDASELKKEGEFKMLNNIKTYFNKHQDTLLTVGFVVLIDHFLFKGALREKIKVSLENLLRGAEDKFHKEA